ncbi:MAG: polysaccharide deacetylase family protein [Bacteroidota bacterium]
MLLIYSHKITNRLTYVTKQIFGGILGVETKLTTKVEDFIKHSGPKITYTKQALQNEFFVRSNDLLFEQGINDLDIRVSDWEGVPCFFATDENSAIPYDVFSASFFLLSRYEEYLPHVKDNVGRYPAKESLAYKNKFLELPVVDLWANKLFSKLKTRFPDIQSKKREYTFTSIVNVTASHCYAHRGLVRTLGGYLLDFGKLGFRRMMKRTSVLMRLSKDPYDNFDKLVQIHKKYKAKSMFFFQFAEYSAHDKNISPHNNTFRYLIKSIADYSVVSLSTSFLSSTDKVVLKEEKKGLGGLIHRPIKYARLRYNRVNVPATYRTLIDAEFTNDFSMGYTHQIGFRAGTCTPFYFYDISLESKQPLRVHPFALHDYALLNYKKPNEVFDKIDVIFRNVRAVKGSFITIFSNELLGSKHKIPWISLYESLIKRYHV